MFLRATSTHFLAAAHTPRKCPVDAAIRWIRLLHFDLLALYLRYGYTRKANSQTVAIIAPLSGVLSLKAGWTTGYGKAVQINTVTLVPLSQLSPTPGPQLSPTLGQFNISASSEPTEKPSPTPILPTSAPVFAPSHQQHTSLPTSGPQLSPTLTQVQKTCFERTDWKTVSNANSAHWYTGFCTIATTAHQSTDTGAAVESHTGAI